MLVMVSWELYPETKMDAFAAFSQMSEEDDAADLGLDVKMIGRWHDLAAGSGTAVVESASVEAVYSWVMNWAPMISATVTPVLDDEGARSVVKEKLGLIGGEKKLREAA